MSGAADLVVLNGDVRPMDGRGRRHEAVAARGGRICALGSTAELEALIGAGTVVIDAGGRTVLPGFIDAHTHLGLVAKSFATAVDCRTPTVSSIEQLLDRISVHASRVAPGTWILVQGSSFQDRLLADGRFPTPDELTRVSAVHPIVYRSTLHHNVANRCALEMAGIDENTPDPPSGIIERDASGRPTGVMAEMFDRFPFPPPTDEELGAALKDVAWNQYLANGVTSIQEIWDSAPLMRQLGQSVRAREIPLRVRAYGWVPLAGSLEAIAAGDLGGVEAEADWFEVGGVKLFADGGTSSHTAAFYEDYTDAPGSRGELTYELDELAAMIATAQGASAQVMVHAAGDRAQDQMLDAVERAGGATEAFRHRIEHGANTAWTAARAEKARRLGVIPVPNPGFIRTYGDFWETALGERAIGRIPLKSLFEAGVPVAGNADTTGGDPALLNPLHNMWCAMTRRTITDRLVDPEERLSVDQALTMYTRLAAYVGHSEASRGTLETGKLADIVVLSHAVDDVQPEDFREMRVDHTIIDGRLAYTAPADEAHDAVRRPAEGLAVSPEPRSR